MILYPKDLLRIPALNIRTERTARRKYQAVKDAFEKQKHQVITLDELAAWLGVEPKEVIPANSASLRTGSDSV